MKKLPLILGALTYVAVFLWGYASVVAPAFSNTGFTYTWPGVPTMEWVTLLCLIPVLAMPIELRKPSTLIIWWLYVTTYVPSLLMPVITLNMADSTLFPLQLAVVGTMLLLCAVPHAKTLALPRIRLSSTVFWWFLGITWGGCIVFSLSSITPSKILLNFALLFAGESEYTLRADFFTQVAESGRAIAYIGNELSRGIDPFLMAYGLLSRRWWLLAAGIGGQVLYFGETGTKDVLFGLLFLTFIYKLAKKYSHNFGLVFLLAISALVVSVTVVDLATSSALLSTHFTRRTLAGPGQLTGFYFEHYSMAPHPGHNFTGTGSFQVYGPPQEIGLYYFGSANVDANASFWAEGFAEYGITGMIAFGLLVAIMLWLFDSIASKHMLELGVLLAVMQADALSNSTPLTILVTHGGILTGIILYFAPKVNPPQQVLDRDHSEEQTAAIDLKPSFGAV